MPKWLLLLLNGVVQAPDGAEGGAPAPADPAPSGEAAPEVGSKPEGEPEGNGSLIPDEPVAEGDAKPVDAPAAAEEPPPINLSTLKLPEGMKADDPALGKLVETLSDPKLSPAQRTEALLAQHGEILTSVATAAQAQLADNYRTMNDGWISEIKSDPDLGGAKFDQTISTIAKAIDSWSPDAKATRQALALTGAGNNPAILRTFHAMAVALGEGKPAQGSAAKPAKSAVDLLYGGAATPQA